MNGLVTRSITIQMILLLCLTVVGPGGRASDSGISAGMSSQISTVQILHFGQQVDYLTAGKRPGEYRITITGQSFNSSSKSRCLEVLRF